MTSEFWRPLANRDDDVSRLECSPQISHAPLRIGTSVRKLLARSFGTTHEALYEYLLDMEELHRVEPLRF